MIDSENRNKILTEVKPVENLSKNLQNPIQKENLLLHKLQDYAWVIESFLIKGRWKLTEKLAESIKRLRSW